MSSRHRRIALYDSAEETVVFGANGFRIFPFYIDHEGKTNHRVYGSFSVSQPRDQRILDIQLLVLDEPTLIEWLKDRGIQFNQFIAPKRFVVDSGKRPDGRWEFEPVSGHFFLVLDNRHSSMTPKTVKFTVWEEWDEIITGLDVVVTVPPTDRALHDETIRLIKNSRKNLLIMTPYIDMEVLNEILAKISSGVPVSIITREKGEFIGKDKKAAFEHLHSRLGPNHRVNNLIHARMIVRDQEEVLVSSADLSHDSLVGQFNCGLVCSDPKIIKKAADFCNLTWTKSHEVK